MLVRAAFHLADQAEAYTDVLRRAEVYIEKEGGIDGLRRRFGKDKTFAVPILTNCALAGLVDWSEVARLPFELACLPFDRLKWLRLPVVSYAIPALVAIGQAVHFHRKPRGPLRWIRQKAICPSLRVLERMQPDSGGFLEATPLTSFVVMSLASIGQVDHPVVRRGVEFLLRSARENHAWPIDEDLSTWVTTLSLNALLPVVCHDNIPEDSLADEHRSSCFSVSERAERCPAAKLHAEWETLLRTLLDRQQTEVHPFTSAEPGGWGWTGLSGAVPDVDDTAGALLALHALREKGLQKNWLTVDNSLDQAIRQAAATAIGWLLSVQNRDGGWPTFCRGWGTMPFDRSTVDLTAHVLRAFKMWHDLDRRIEAACERGFVFLSRVQQEDGSWSPLWFGNQHHPAEENPIFGTARVLLAYRDYHKGSTSEAQRGADWLVGQQNSDGGWGGNLADRSSTEETAVTLSALIGGWTEADYGDRIEQGLNWLISAVETDDYRHASPIGLYFSRLWYYERLYPLIFTVDALRRSVDR
jgi:squalene-hopene/tetraprenyl-beta-curcumene cyclase